MGICSLKFRVHDPYMFTDTGCLNVSLSSCLKHHIVTKNITSGLYMYGRWLDLSNVWPRAFGVRRCTSAFRSAGLLSWPRRPYTCRYVDMPAMIFDVKLTLCDRTQAEDPSYVVQILKFHLLLLTVEQKGHLKTSTIMYSPCFCKASLNKVVFLYF